MARGLTAAPPAARRRAALAGLAVAVLAAHVTLLRDLADRIGGLGLEEKMPERIAVSYVRELEPAAPPAVAPAPPARAPVAAAPRAVRPAASAPTRKPAPEVDAAPEPVPETVAEAPPQRLPDPAPEAVADAALAETPPVAASEPAPDAAQTPVTGTDAPVAATPDPTAEPQATAANAALAASAVPATAMAPRFEWPGPTRLSYRLVGNVRGEVHGDAQVEWVRAGTRYQVHVDVRVGLPFAPLYSRRMTSDGELTPEGLAPRRYDEETHVAFRDRRRLSVRFERDAVLLPGGQRRERPPGVQDSASQFVQLAYLFTIKPELLREGTTVVVPIALPRHVSPWVYEVTGKETVYTLFGAVQAHHLRPQGTVRPGDLGAEMWIAPTLRYLPVRILIRQDADTWLDLVIARRPEIADPLPDAPVRPAGSR